MMKKKLKIFEFALLILKMPLTLYQWTFIFETQKKAALAQFSYS